MKKSAYFLLGRVRHQFLNEFCIPAPPPSDMDLPFPSRVVARSRHAVTVASQDKHVLREVNYTDYLAWYRRVGKPYLFVEAVRDSQRRMWYASDWVKGFEEQFASFYEDIWRKRELRWRNIIRVLLSCYIYTGTSFYIILATDINLTFFFDSKII